jgi:transposase-like protein
MEKITAFFDSEKTKGMPHNGKLLHSFITHSRLSITEVARRMDVMPSTLHCYFKSYSLSLEVWWRASKAVHYNFPAALGELLPVDYTTSRETELQATCEQLKKENERLQMELNIYKSLKSSGYGA